MLNPDRDVRGPRSMAAWDLYRWWGRVSRRFLVIAPLVICSTATAGDQLSLRESAWALGQDVAERDEKYRMFKAPERISQAWYWGMLGTFLLDVAGSKAQFDRGGRELNPVAVALFGERPSVAQMIAGKAVSYAPIAGGVVVLDQTGHPRAAKITAGSWIAANGIVGVGNLAGAW